MAAPKASQDPKGDENNDDTFGSSMVDVGTLVLCDNRAKYMKKRPFS